MPDKLRERTDFYGAMQEELKEIDRRRKTDSPTSPERAGESPAANPRTAQSASPVNLSKKELTEEQKEAEWKAACHRRQLFGISISGGGIRSATFALGVLQGLARKNILQAADYLSTVSGGGYIGTWLQGILYRAEQAGIAAETANPGVATPDPYEPLKNLVPGPASEDPISFLRKYSNYLAPRRGLSVDSLIIPMIWSRNMVLNQAIIIAAFLAALLLAFFPGVGFGSAIVSGSTSKSNLYLILAIVMGGISIIFMSRSLSAIAQRTFLGSRQATNTGQDTNASDSGSEVFFFVVIPIFLAVVLLMLAIFSNQPAWFVPTHPWMGSVFLFVLLGCLQAFGGFRRCYAAQRENPESRRQTVKNRIVPFVHIAWMTVLTGLFTMLLLYGLTEFIRTWQPASAFGSQLTIAFAPPLYVLVLMAGIVLQIGLMGRDFPDASREWLSRAGTLFWIVCAVWIVYFSLTLFIPYGLSVGWQDHGGSITSAVGAWLATTAAAVFSGKSGKTNGAEQGNGNKTSSTLDLIARYGPYVAITGFLVMMAFVVQWLLHGDLSSLAYDSYWNAFPVLASADKAFVGVLFFGAVAVFYILSSRVNINEFSMHHFYKNRLVRCYLGPRDPKNSQNKRRPDLFTGFDPQDDIELAKLVCATPTKWHKPYPILNATLNVTAGTDLATQERKGLPWMFTPLYSGFASARSQEDRDARGDKVGLPETYAATSTLGSSGGIGIGTAMAISGAAANPNWGSHSAPQTAFLLTLFNVRLGWWVGNPRKLENFKRPGPRTALLWLFRELFGELDEASGYLNLSDGGHFENLGLYELVRRRCHYVIAIDGEQDADYQFEGLGGAVRKCRADFGVNIVINPRPIQLKDGISHFHCAVGRIYYPESPELGWLLYIKSSVTGDEPADVEQYRRSHPDFPQQSTLQQFFNESQFESYRELGLHAINVALANGDSFPANEREKYKTFFEGLEKRWKVEPAS